MSPEDRVALIDAYKAWTPDNGVTIDELATSHGVTKSALYAMLRRENVPLHTGRGVGGRPGAGGPPLLEEMGRVAIAVILDQLTDLKIENRRLQARVDDLERSREPVSAR